MSDTALDDLYRERAHLLANLAAHYPSTLVARADPEQPAWPVLFVELPTGQACWHIAERDTDLFDHIGLDRTDKQRPRSLRWDGHTTEQKYARLGHATRIRATEGRAG